MEYNSTTMLLSLSTFDADAVFAALEIECYGASHGLQGIGDPADDLTPALWEAAARVVDEQWQNDEFGDIVYGFEILRRKVAHRVARAIINVHGLNENVA